MAVLVMPGGGAGPWARGAGVTPNTGYSRVAIATDITQHLGYSADVASAQLRVLELQGPSGLEQLVQGHLAPSQSPYPDYVYGGSASTRFQLLLYRGSASRVLSKLRQEDRLLFPVNPEEVSFSRTRSYGTYDIVNAPQMLQLGVPQLRQVSFSSFFPAQYDPDYCQGPELDRNANEATRWIWAAMARDEPLSFAAVGESIIPALPVHVTSFTPTYRAGHPLDIFFDLELTEHRQPTLRKLAGPAPGFPDRKFSSYVTRAGDTLHEIAKRAYGDGRYWDDVHAANDFGSSVKPDDALSAQLHLVIPELGQQVR
jgi:hypothetical protein